MNIAEVGLFPLIKIGFQKLFSNLSKLFWLFMALLFGKRADDKRDASGGWYTGVTVLSVLGTVALASFSFIGSFSAASDFALKNGIDESVAFLIPVTVDGLIIICILAIFGASLGGYSAAWLSLVVMAFTGVSIYFNVSHMPDDISAINRYLLGGVFPVIVFISSEATSWQIKRAVGFTQNLLTYQELLDANESLTRRKVLAETDLAAMGEQHQGLKATIEDYKTTVASLERDLTILAASADADGDNSETIYRRVQILRLKDASPAITQAQLAEQLGTSQKTISRDIGDLKKVLHLNGTVNGKA